MVAESQQACIVGIGQTEFSKASGRSEQQLAAEAVLMACQDAGVSPLPLISLTRLTSCGLWAAGILILQRVYRRAGRLRSQHLFMLRMPLKAGCVITSLSGAR